MGDDSPSEDTTLSHIPRKLTAERVEQLLEHGDVLLPSERTICHDYQLITAGQLLELGETVDQKRRELANLESRFLSLQRENEKYARIINPIRLFPSEILVEIFIHSVEADSAAENAHRERWLSNSFSQRHPVWVITRVCKQWRDIALGLPRLWAQISLIFDERARTSADASVLLRIVQYLVKRSGDAPLYVSLVFPNSSEIKAPFIAPLRDLLQSLRDTSGRWVSLFIQMRASLAKSILSPLDGHFGNLRSLYVKAYFQKRGISYIELAMFKTAPKLTTFGGDARIFDLVPLPTHLTEYDDLGAAPPAGVTLLKLKLMPMIETLSLRSRVSHPAGNFISACTLHALTTLRVTGQENAYTVVSRIRCPNLKCLHIRFGYKFYPTRVAKELKSYGCRIQALTIHFDRRYFIQEDDFTSFMEFIGRFPDLEQLALHNISAPMCNSFLHSLKSDVNAVPNLQNLEMRYGSNYRASLMQALQVARPLLQVSRGAYGDDSEAGDGSTEETWSLKNLLIAGNHRERHVDYDSDEGYVTAEINDPLVPESIRARRKSRPKPKVDAWGRIIRD